MWLPVTFDPTNSTFEESGPNANVFPSACDGGGVVEAWACAGVLVSELTEAAGTLSAGFEHPINKTVGNKTAMNDAFIIVSQL